MGCEGARLERPIEIAWDIFEIIKRAEDEETDPTRAFANYANKCTAGEKLLPWDAAAKAVAKKLMASKAAAKFAAKGASQGASGVACRVGSKMVKKSGKRMPNHLRDN